MPYKGPCDGPLSYPGIFVPWPAGARDTHRGYGMKVLR